MKSVGAMSTVGIISPGHFERLVSKVKSAERMSHPNLSIVLVVL